MKLANLQPYRWMMALACICILLSGVYFMLLYWFVLLASLEWLNMQSFYIQNWRRLNWFFTGYLYFILLVRAIHWRWNLHFREAVNIVEHLLFAMVACTLLLLRSIIANARLRLNKRLLAVFIFFNAVGLVNEVYQNIVVGRVAAAFVADSLKDIAINVLGSLLAIMVLFIMARRSANFSTLTYPAT